MLRSALHALAARGSVVLHQAWNDLLFAHWPMPPEDLRPRLPAALELDTFEGRAWIGLTPFVLSGLRPSGLPALPGVSRFPELNLRTYVRHRGSPGICFFSLDAGRALAVAGARLGYFLPYYLARMDVRSEAGLLRYDSRRIHPGAPPAAFRAEYAPDGPETLAPRGSLAHWLTERYRLFTRGPDGRLFRGEVRHAPWRLSPARATIHENTMAEAAGLRLPDLPPLLHFARRQDVAALPLAVEPS